MSTYQAIAATTLTISYLTGSAVRSAVPEAVVTLTAPDQQPAASKDEPRLNIYLVQVVPNPVMRTMDLPSRSDTGGLTAAPRVALNLRYLLSFFGPAAKAHQMLGAAEIALRENAVFDPALIGAALADQPDLQTSGLAEQSPPVQITPVGITLEELSRFWSGFFQVPYTLSTIYEASVVIIESTLAPSVTLPVRTVNVTESGFAPHLEPLPAIDYGAGVVVPVTGRGLSLGQFVEVDGQWIPLQAVAGGLGFPLPASITAGLHPLRLGQQRGTPPSTPSVLPGSNSQPLVVRPVVESVAFDASAAQVSLTISPPPGSAQPIALSLVALQNAVGGAGSSVRLVTASSRQGSVVSFRTPSLPPGPFLAVVEVDGVPSSPIFSDDEYSQPQVQIT
jgi:Pvc16 N-terminal domain